MTPNESPDFGPEPGDEDESARIRRKLLWRMGVASLMIVVLLGGLMLFDRLATAPREPEYIPPRFTDPVPVPPKPVTQTLGPVVPMPPPEEDGNEETEKPLQTSDTSVPEATTAPVIPIDAPSAELAPPSSPDVTARPAPGRVTTKPSPRAAATAQPAVPPSAPSPLPTARSRQRTGQEPASPRAETLRQGTPRAEATRVEAPGPEATRSEATRALPSRQSSTLPRPLSGYTLQAGVFTDPRRAEEIHTRLAQEGIPVTLETRVLVGPFRNRNEAESARAKMKAMGIDALLVPRSGRK
jgi:DedD protein